MRTRGAGIKELGFDFERRDDELPGWPYVVLKDRRVIGRAKSKRHAAIFAWAMAVQGVLTDRKIIAFMVAVMGLMELSGEGFAQKKVRPRHGATSTKKQARRQ